MAPMAGSIIMPNVGRNVPGEFLTSALLATDCTIFGHLTGLMSQHSVGTRHRSLHSLVNLLGVSPSVPWPRQALNT